MAFWLIACPLLLAAGAAVAAGGPAAAGPNRDLADFYRVPAHYRAVAREVLGWHHTTRNGCVAFASTALRRVGVEVPAGRARRITLDLSRYLEEELGWDLQFSQRGVLNLAHDLGEARLRHARREIHQRGELRR